MLKLMVMVGQSNGPGGLLHSPLVMARAPKCLLAAQALLQTGKSTIRDAIRISNRLPASPPCHCLSGYTQCRRENNRKKTSSKCEFFCHEQMSVTNFPPAPLPPDIEQHHKKEFEIIEKNKSMSVTNFPQLRYLQTLNSISAENNSTIIFPVKNYSHQTIIFS